jgi:hypothetical protein
VATPTFSAQSLGGGVVRVTWQNMTPLKIARNGVDNSGYGAWSTDLLSPSGVPSANLAAHAFDFANLVQGQTYTFTATFAGGILTAPLTVPISRVHSVAIPTITATRSGTEINWTWSAYEQDPSHVVPYPAITHFIVEINGFGVGSVNAGHSGVNGVPSATGSFHLTHALDGSALVLRVQAVGLIDGQENTSDWGYAPTVTLPSPPPAFTGEALGGGVVRVHWQNITPTKLGNDGVDASGYGPFDTNQFNPPGVPSSALASQSFDFVNLVAGRTYTLTVTYPGGSLTTQVTAR